MYFHMSIVYTKINVLYDINIKRIFMSKVYTVTKGRIWEVLTIISNHNSLILCPKNNLYVQNVAYLKSSLMVY